MICNACNNVGIIRLNWADAPDEFAVCLCPAGNDMRAAVNNHRKVAPLWRVWCAREQVDPGLVFMVEDVLTPDELLERGLVRQPVQMDRGAALLAAGRLKRR